MTDKRFTEIWHRVGASGGAAVLVFEFWVAVLQSLAWPIRRGCRALAGEGE